ncbi:dethiobiotin synthase [Candidatus Berkiella aquae]|uniref:ATP-dependent dethiobiotin synthetase BioD n=1 Tax=Candidatus Berkiella aquae TaxID=295108 RepID=A0A0Q9YN04_9GAMM|nr:dethiobiotin synthase [Candidatus Berkiella aquae]MCS5712632.1 dethiobiotin synthase [Candidatus Berkiella aquae]
MAGIFIAATGTEIGKTFITAQLLQYGQHRRQPFWVSKPVISGWPQTAEAIPETDTAILLKAAALPLDDAHIQAISPWRFTLPLTPDMAAKAEGSPIDIDELIAFCQHRSELAKAQGKIHLIEGVGGLMSPINGRFTNLEWIKALNSRCILVTGSYLGALSHTLTALQVLWMQKIEVIAVVVNASFQSRVSLQATSDYLKEYVVDIPVITIPWQQNAAYAHNLPLLYDVLLQEAAN